MDPHHPIFIMRGPFERSTDIYTTVRLKTGSSETSGSGEVFDLKLRHKSRILVTLDPQQYSEWFLDVINNLPTCLIGLLVQNLKQLKSGLSNGMEHCGDYTQYPISSPNQNRFCLEGYPRLSFSYSLTMFNQ